MAQKIQINRLACALAALALFAFVPQAARAATLYFSPSVGSYAIGQVFSVSAYVSSPDQAMNAASGVVSFPQDELEVTSLSKTGSVFTLWVQEPSFQNSLGTIYFEGIVLNPGFTGSAGKVITINFRVKAGGAALLSFASGSVLANDGTGTNILASLGNAQFSFGSEAPSAPESTTPSAISNTPSAPQISSPTHPEPTKWYAAKDAKFIWKVPQGVSAVRLLVGKISTAIPMVVYEPAIGEKEISNVDDGVWYFNVQFRNASGWGGVSHFRFQIDTAKPSRFDVTEVPRQDATEPKAAFLFEASDTASGIDHYEVQIDNGNSQIWQDAGSHRYQAPVLAPGKHTLIAKAVDKAGNALASSAEFTVEALKTPVLTEYPKQLQNGEILTIKGKTNYPNATANVWLQHEKDDAKSYSAKTDGSGSFTFVADGKVSGGVYAAWAEAVDARGARSLPSEKVTFAVQRPAFLQMGSFAVSLLAVVVPLVVLAFALAFILWYGLHRFSTFRKRLRKEVREAESTLHTAFDALKESIAEQVAMLEKTRAKRQLTEEEEKIVKRSKKDLDGAEKLIRKEIEDIEKEVK